MRLEIPNPELSVIEHYGLRHDIDKDCLSNGLINAIRVNLKDKPFPQIYFLHEASHAYLLWRNLALNSGVTGAPGRFPDFSFEYVQAHGKNQTKILIENVLPAFFRNPGDQIITPYDHTIDRDYQRYDIETVFFGDQLIKAINCLKLALLEP